MEPLIWMLGLRRRLQSRGTVWRDRKDRLEKCIAQKRDAWVRSELLFIYCLGETCSPPSPKVYTPVRRAFAGSATAPPSWMRHRNPALSSSTSSSSYVWSQFWHLRASSSSLSPSSLSSILTSSSSNRCRRSWMIWNLEKAKAAINHVHIGTILIWLVFIRSNPFTPAPYIEGGQPFFCSRRRITIIFRMCSIHFCSHGRHLGFWQSAKLHVRKP